MQLTIESALSFGGLIGHLSYFLLILSMLMRVMWKLRVLVIAAALVGIYYNVAWLGDPVGLLWDSLMLLVNIVQLAITYYLNERSKFNAEESAFVDRQFPGLSKSLKRQLLDKGNWVDMKAGDKLTDEGTTIDSLVYVADGQAEITSDNAVVGLCETGSFIGEMTVFTGEPANGTSVVTRPSRVWKIKAADLRSIAARNVEIDQALKACFHRVLMEKLIQTNKIVADYSKLKTV